MQSLEPEILHREYFKIEFRTMEGPICHYRQATTFGGTESSRQPSGLGAMESSKLHQDPEDIQKQRHREGLAVQGQE